MLLAVAGSEPYRVFALLDEPLWRVLYVFRHLTEEQARAALRERLARVDAGVMTAFAVNQPASLDDELRRVQDAIATLERGPVEVEDTEALRARGLALADRISKGRALAPEALVS